MDSTLEALQARLAGRAHALRAGASTARAAGSSCVAHEAELGGEKGILAAAAQRPPDQLLVGVRAVRVGRVEEVHAQVERVLEGRQRLVVVVRAVELAHAHAAESQGGDASGRCGPVCGSASGTLRQVNASGLCARGRGRFEYAIRERAGARAHRCRGHVRAAPAAKLVVEAGEQGRERGGDRETPPDRIGVVAVE